MERLTTGIKKAYPLVKVIVDEIRGKANRVEVPLQARP
jgi:hypothetical protein